ncbi:NB-ARC domain-containing protein [Actinoallomurus sp. NBC_01490]|uniref:AfsR/SARP family transcriptional regulator n=1 Tax=Actinoallomurus sp. NBC_01490 TaxID=2903557 RepID=UPI002E2F2828|nr:BTAD domain-containing putative transcriptional regulator [Actinoallomurus sp. NBC_01490]
MDGVDLLSVDAEFSLLGPTSVRMGQLELSPGQPLQCAVLASLLLRGGAPASMSALVDDVWGEDAPASAIGSIRTYVYRLRRTLKVAGNDHIYLSEAGYSLRIDPDALDVNRFKRLLAEARAAEAAGDVTLASTVYAAGLALWRGPALAGVPGPHAQAQRTLLGELRLASLEGRLACDVERGRYVESAAELSALVSEHPLRERLCELFMIALYGAGRQSEALTAFHTITHTLREGLGISPSPRLRKVHELILTDQLQLPHLGLGVSPGHLCAASFPPAQLPGDLPCFVGRDEESESVTRLVTGATRPPSAVTVVVDGMPGVGKTAFMVHMAHRLADRFPDGQLFVDLQGFGPERRARDPMDVLGEFLEALGVPAGKIPAGTQRRAVLFRGILANRRVAVVLDNARDSEQVRDLLPGAGGSIAMVTSRVQLPGLVVTHQAAAISLEPLSMDESRRFLVHAFGSARARAEPGATADVADLCEGLPLALSIVGAKAAYRPSMPVASIAADIRSKARFLDAFTNDGEPALDVRSALSWSYEVLSPECADLFHALGGFTADDLTVEAVAPLVQRPASHVGPCLDTLARVHLLAERAPGRYAMNGFMRAYAAELAELRPHFGRDRPQSGLCPSSDERDGGPSDEGIRREGSPDRAADRAPTRPQPGRGTREPAD